MTNCAFRRKRARKFQIKTFRAIALTKSSAKLKPNAAMERRESMNAIKGTTEMGSLRVSSIKNTRADERAHKNKIKSSLKV